MPLACRLLWRLASLRKRHPIPTFIRTQSANSLILMAILSQTDPCRLWQPWIWKALLWSLTPCALSTIQRLYRRITDDNPICSINSPPRR
ncbi:hypothetical protein CABS01_01448 [Colletotrichum abscissum]|uniref:Uncharacterized protein n=1 Tax=Colletotrichum abscissum TaxID=1671311 RepID=A0A9P9X5B2_9PEZI|nr:uncharacterized protein CABS01_01448 [Colletotrichum abscissum]KAI3536573.1 hypothetical protein CABS02_12515 [Colletotrichum abscissum]KAK1495641.1 hypothetical protein CABS01_01448 [Colletotrichum abscissum]